MRHEDVRIGMKVVPFQKLASNTPMEEYFKHSPNGKFLKINGFLYVVDYHHDAEHWMLSSSPDGKSGDFFDAEDFAIYVGYNGSLEQTPEYKELQALRAFKDVIDSLYGIGLEVKGWHQNGNLETFDKFYESAVECMCEVNKEGSHEM